MEYAMNTLMSNMQYLCDETRMLSGITVAYGTPSSHETAQYGRAQELELGADGLWHEKVRLLQADSLYDLASLSKLFASVLMMQLVERGKLSLDAEVGALDPRFVHLKHVSVFDVLSFRTCLQTPGRIDDAPSREEGLQRLFDVRPVPLPAVRLYSDINAMVIKYVIEAVCNLPFSEALRTLIFQPVGMARTYAVVPEQEKGHCVCYNYEHRIMNGRYVLRTDTPAGTAHDPKAAFLSEGGRDLCGHAGLFSSCADMVRFAQALLRGEVISKESLAQIGTNRTGLAYADGTHRQYLGYLCFSKHPNQYFSEVPAWMSSKAVGLSGFTGNHLSVDPVRDRFVLFLGNRCHARLSHIAPRPETLAPYGLEENGTGCVMWPDGQAVPSSVHYVHFKDAKLHAPIEARMRELGWLAD